MKLKYPFTHDLAELLETAMPHRAELAEFETTLPSLSEYAVGARYDDAFLPSIPKLHEDFTVVRATLGTIERLLSTARPL